MLSFRKYCEIYPNGRDPQKIKENQSGKRSQWNQKRRVLDAVLPREDFIDFVNWLGMSDVVVKEEGDGWFRIQFVETES